MDVEVEGQRAEEFSMSTRIGHPPCPFAMTLVVARFHCMQNTAHYRTRYEK